MSRVLRANCNFDKFAKFVDGVYNIEIRLRKNRLIRLNFYTIDMIFYNRNRSRNVIILIETNFLSFFYYQNNVLYVRYFNVKCLSL